ncbi:MAG TPA: preprotein translocase subunit SecB [Clostridiaceae bacterium]
MNVDKVMADFQLLRTRVSEFSLLTKPIEPNGIVAKLEYNLDYNILNITEEDNKFTGYLEFIVEVKAKIKNSLLFKVSFNLEGVFMGNPNVLDSESFRRTMELNGVATLSQLSRSYIISTTALLGLNPPVRLPMANIVKLRELKNKLELERKNETEYKDNGKSI